MKQKFISLFIIILSVYSCCSEKNVEIERYPLSESEKSMIPYTEGQKIRFIHTNGYEFYFSVTEEKLKWGRAFETQDWVHCGDDYSSYQYKTVTLMSTYPKLSFYIEFGNLTYRPMYNPDDNNNIYTDSLRSVFIQLNKSHYTRFNFNKSLEFISDSENNTCYDSILVNGKTYKNVIEAKFEYYNDSIQDVTPKSILYYSKGLIQLKLNNNETYSIKE